MSFLHIAYYTLIKNFRDWKFILLLVVAPILTILITGNATVNIDEHLKTEKINVIYLDADSTPMTKQFDNFLHTRQIKNSFAIKNAASYEEGYDQVQKGKVEAFIYIPKGFSIILAQGGKTNIEVYSSKSLSPVKFLVEGFVNSVNASWAISSIGGRADYREISGGVSQNAVSATGKAPTGLDMWTYLNMLLFLFYGAVLGSLSVINGIRKNTQIRFAVAPINSLAYVGGLFLGNLATLLACILLIIPTTYLAFGSNWHGNMLIILLTFLLYSSITVALGMIIGYLIKKPGLSVLTIISLNGLFGFIVSFSMQGDTNVFFKLITRLSPHYYSYTVITDTIFHGPPDRMQSSLLTLAVTALIIATLTLVLGRRRPA